MKNKVIFLDLDGVLSIKSNNINKRGGTWKLNDTKQQMFQYILDSTQAKIVLSSSWRQIDLESTKEYLEEEGFWFNNYLIDITPDLNRPVEYFLAKSTLNLKIPRGLEIQQWLDTTKLNISNYLILDDDTDILYNQKNNFINTNTYTGISIKNVINSISILNS